MTSDKNSSLIAAITDREATPYILISACLIGMTCRYDGNSKNLDERLMATLLKRKSNEKNAPENPAAELAKIAFEQSANRPDVHELQHTQLLDILIPRGVIPICPELFGKLPCPRLPADFFGGDGASLVDGKGARLINRAGQDVSDQFFQGAQTTLTMAAKGNISLAILKEGSPSCGVHKVYIDGAKVQGVGVTSELLRRQGIRRMTENDLTTSLESG